MATINKKTYEQPVMKVVEIEEAAIIAQSTQSTFGIKGGEAIPRKSGKINVSN